MREHESLVTAARQAQQAARKLLRAVRLYEDGKPAQARVAVHHADIVLGVVEARLRAYRLPK